MAAWHRVATNYCTVDITAHFWRRSRPNRISALNESGAEDLWSREIAASNLGRRGAATVYQSQFSLPSIPGRLISSSLCRLSGLQSWWHIVRERSGPSPKTIRRPAQEQWNLYEHHRPISDRLREGPYRWRGALIVSVALIYRRELLRSVRHSAAMSLRRWLQLFRFDCDSTSLRPFDDRKTICCRWAAALRPK